MDTTVFTWDIAAGLPVVLDDGDARYVYGATVLISQVTVADTYYYLTDGPGSTMVTTDSAGDVANAYTYDVFGAPRSQTGAQANEFQFAGEQADASTGLQYLRARYYDFEVGRFISREPLAVLPGWGGNPFGYAAGNPVSLVDPTGEVPVDANGCTPKDITCQVDNSCHWQRGTDPYGRGARCDWEQNNCYISSIEGVVCLGPAVVDGPRLIGEYERKLGRAVLEGVAQQSPLTWALHTATKACAESESCRRSADEALRTGDFLSLMYELNQIGPPLPLRFTLIQIYLMAYWETYKHYYQPR